MKLEFKKLIIHNFLSYGHVELNLSDKGYCLVSGENYFEKDNAKSNGAGKSTWSSAICWALTGETIQGLSTNIKNINVDEDLCYVKLEFICDSSKYEVIRYKNPKSDLKIFLNDEEISGKGIRESEIILSKYIPDLTSSLIASTIILGQGLPFKFTDYSPSGRKDLLEKLSKSDFMIQDLKERVAARSQSLNSEIRSIEDKLLEINTELNVTKKQILEQKQKLENLSNPNDFDSKISELKVSLTELDVLISEKTSILADKEALKRDANNKLNSIYVDKNNLITNENSKFSKIQTEYFENKSKLQTSINTLQNKIHELSNITDICPTCGQKIPNISKPDLTHDIEKLASLNYDLNNIENLFKIETLAHSDNIKNIEANFSSDIKDINLSLKDLYNLIDVTSKELNIYKDKYVKAQTELNKYIIQKNNYEETVKELEKSLYNLSLHSENLSNDLLYNNRKKDDLQNHLNVVNQMNTLLKRDFRGYLLTNIIEYISKKVSEYSEIIFENSDLEFKLEGNNINISYCKKSFENLSGGEQQKVNLIIQLAIRDMMQNYLNFSSNILILDEIFDQLDITGCNKVLDLILNKFTDIESIFIISHRSGELEIPYDSEFVVIKDMNGVSKVICR